MRRYSLLLLILLASTAIAEEPKKAGADWWSLQPVTRPTLPAVKNPTWTRNPIDVFVLARLEAAGLTPAPESEPATLLRRLFFDLIGLPPSPEDIDDFLRAFRAAPQAAMEKVVDRLLASPRYGERWGRHWLDVARFAESQGFERDKIRDNAWRYRDYVIDSFNRDKPYDQFVREQLAGDVLPSATAEMITATGFLVAGPYDEAGTSSASPIVRGRVREEEMEDMLAAMSQTFLGLTVNCARCHDHKFDPILQRDYYRFKSVFDGVRHDGYRPLPAAELKQRADKIAQLDQSITVREQRLAELERLGRSRIRPTKVDGLPAPGPKPISRWTFDKDARDDIGKLHGKLHGNAKIDHGRLILDGKDSFMETEALSSDLREKTLEAWVVVANKNQRGGGAMSVQTKDGKVFDAIVFGERQPGKWMAGSDFFRRTRDHYGLDENAGPTEVIQVAVAYAHDGSIVVFRNGKPYFEPYRPQGNNAELQFYASGQSQVLFGLRHTGAGNGYLACEIEEARLYDKTLTANEVAASYLAGVPAAPVWQILDELTPEERSEHKIKSAEVRRLRAERDRIPPNIFLGYVATIRQPEPTNILLRGDIEKIGDVVSPGGLSVLRNSEFGLPPDAPEAQRRLKFADWVASPQNPLTSRVIVNRLWHYHFGRGLVATPNDFGFNGERPSHPELLDWLASECGMRNVERGIKEGSATSTQNWGLKHIHRLIVTSATYRQSSSFPKSEIRIPNSKDEENRLLWHFAPRRLEAEAVRDAMLAISGQLRHAGGGPGFRPFKVTVFNSSFYDLIDEDRPEFNRRTVYRIGVNSAKDPLLEAFDCPEPSVKAPKRNITTTPLQALGLMNNAFVQRQAKSFAARVQREAGENVEAQIDRACRVAIGRNPSVTERTRLIGLAREHGLTQVCWVLLNSSEFLYVK